MTQELRQAITILQYPILELIDYLKEVAVENPVVEIEDNNFLTSFNNYLKESLNLNYNNEKKEWKILDSIPEPSVSLQEYLLEQIADLNLPNIELKILRFLIGNIDENGYLRITNEEVAAKFNQTLEDIENLVNIIQSFEPVGVGARSLQECLLLQIKKKYPFDHLAYQIINKYFTDFAEKRWNKIAKSLEINLSEVEQISALISTLNPKPGSDFQRTMPVFIIPDLTLEKVEGEYIIFVNDSILPKIRINPYYENLLQAGDQETKNFIKERLNSALWLLKGIEQRRLTLSKVARIIVDEQRDFFEMGKGFLKPLILRDVAEKLGIHESTVSRATANKYMETPRGIFALKDFFATGIRTETGEVIANTNIKLRIKSLIAGENKIKPLSDQEITSILQDQGINISRRTVAKYREELKIPAASKRKRSTP